jgi:SAM-dependent methyltransferase
MSFYLDLARSAGGDVLEIGVGTGRVALELAKAGIRVTGLDLSAECSRSRLRRNGRRYCATAATRMRRHAQLRPRWPGIWSGDRTVPRLFLLTPEDQLAALAGFRRHLRAGGILALNGAPAPAGWEMVRMGGVRRPAIDPCLLISGSKVRVLVHPPIFFRHLINKIHPPRNTGKR